VPRVTPRPREFVRAAGADAADFLQRMVSNDVEALDPGGVCDALLLTPKARLIAPLRVWRRGADDFLLLTEPGLGATVLAALRRARFAAKVELEPEEHESWVVLDEPDGGLPTQDYGVDAAEVLDEKPDGDAIDADELERLRIGARTPAWGRELDERVLPAEAGLVERAVSLTKGCYPGQEPIARQHYRGRVNRTLRLLTLSAPEPPAYDAELRHGEKVVGRVTSAARDDGRVLALGYVRTEVPEDADLEVAGAGARLVS
jgi:folate-binding protein YgfZ